VVPGAFWSTHRLLLCQIPNSYTFGALWPGGSRERLEKALESSWNAEAAVFRAPVFPVFVDTGGASEIAGDLRLAMESENCLVLWSCSAL
jgi:hypothetical protein